MAVDTKIDHVNKELKMVQLQQEIHLQKAALEESRKMTEELQERLATATEHAIVEGKVDKDKATIQALEAENLSLREDLRRSTIEVHSFSADVQRLLDNANATLKAVIRASRLLKERDDLITTELQPQLAKSLISLKEKTAEVARLKQQNETYLEYAKDMKKLEEQHKNMITQLRYPNLSDKAVEEARKKSAALDRLIREVEKMPDSFDKHLVETINTLAAHVASSPVGLPVRLQHLDKKTAEIEKAATTALQQRTERAANSRPVCGNCEFMAKLTENVVRMCTVSPDQLVVSCANSTPGAAPAPVMGVNVGSFPAIGQAGGFIGGTVGSSPYGRVNGWVEQPEHIKKKYRLSEMKAYSPKSTAFVRAGVNDLLPDKADSKQKELEKEQQKSSSSPPAQITFPHPSTNSSPWFTQARTNNSMNNSWQNLLAQRNRSPSPQKSIQLSQPQQQQQQKQIASPPPPPAQSQQQQQQQPQIASPPPPPAQSQQQQQQPQIASPPPPPAQSQQQQQQQQPQIASPPAQEKRVDNVDHNVTFTQKTLPIVVDIANNVLIVVHLPRYITGNIPLIVDVFKNAKKWTKRESDMSKPYYILAVSLDNIGRFRSSDPSIQTFQPQWTYETIWSMIEAGGTQTFHTLTSDFAQIPYAQQMEARAQMSGNVSTTNTLHLYPCVSLKNEDGTTYTINVKALQQQWDDFLNWIFSENSDKIDLTYFRYPLCSVGDGAKLSPSPSQINIAYVAMPYLIPVKDQGCPLSNSSIDADIASKIASDALLDMIRCLPVFANKPSGENTATSWKIYFFVYLYTIVGSNTDKRVAPLESIVAGVDRRDIYPLNVFATIDAYNPLKELHYNSNRYAASQQLLSDENEVKFFLLNKNTSALWWDKMTIAQYFSEDVDNYIRLVLAPGAIPSAQDKEHFDVVIPSTIIHAHSNISSCVYLASVYAPYAATPNTRGFFAKTQHTEILKASFYEEDPYYRGCNRITGVGNISNALLMKKEWESKAMGDISAYLTRYQNKDQNRFGMKGFTKRMLVIVPHYLATSEDEFSNTPSQSQNPQTCMSNFFSNLKAYFGNVFFKNITNLVELWIGGMGLSRENIVEIMKMYDWRVHLGVMTFPFVANIIAPSLYNSKVMVLQTPLNSLAESGIDYFVEVDLFTKRDAGNNNNTFAVNPLWDAFIFVPSIIMPADANFDNISLKEAKPVTTPWSSITYVDLLPDFDEASLMKSCRYYIDSEPYRRMLKFVLSETHKMIQAETDEVASSGQRSIKFFGMTSAEEIGLGLQDAEQIFPCSIFDPEKMTFNNLAAEFAPLFKVLVKKYTGGSNIKLTTTHENGKLGHGDVVEWFSQWNQLGFQPNLTKEDFDGIIDARKRAALRQIVKRMFAAMSLVESQFAHNDNIDVKQQGWVKIVTHRLFVRMFTPEFQPFVLYNWVTQSFDLYALDVDNSVYNKVKIGQQSPQFSSDNAIPEYVDFNWSELKKLDSTKFKNLTNKDQSPFNMSCVIPFRLPVSSNDLNLSSMKNGILYSGGLKLIRITNDTLIDTLGNLQDINDFIQSLVTSVNNTERFLTSFFLKHEGKTYFKCPRLTDIDPTNNNTRIVVDISKYVNSFLRLSLFVIFKAILFLDLTDDFFILNQIFRYWVSVCIFGLCNVFTDHTTFENMLDGYPIITEELNTRKRDFFNKKSNEINDGQYKFYDGIGVIPNQILSDHNSILDLLYNKFHQQDKDYASFLFDKEKNQQFEMKMNSSMNQSIPVFDFYEIQLDPNSNINSPVDKLYPTIFSDQLPFGNSSGGEYIQNSIFINGDLIIVSLALREMANRNDIYLMGLKAMGFNLQQNLEDYFHKNYDKLVCSRGKKQKISALREMKPDRFFRPAWDTVVIQALPDNKAEIKDLFHTKLILEQPNNCENDLTVIKKLTSISTISEVIIGYNTCKLLSKNDFKTNITRPNSPVDKIENKMEDFLQSDNLIERRIKVELRTSLANQKFCITYGQFLYDLVKYYSVIMQKLILSNNDDLKNNAAILTYSLEMKEKMEDLKNNEKLDLDIHYICRPFMQRFIIGCNVKFPDSIRKLFTKPTAGSEDYAFLQREFQYELSDLITSDDVESFKRDFDQRMKDLIDLISIVISNSKDTIFSHDELYIIVSDFDHQIPENNKTRFGFLVNLELAPTSTPHVNNPSKSPQGDLNPLHNLETLPQYNLSRFIIVTEFINNMVSPFDQVFYYDPNLSTQPQQTTVLSIGVPPLLSNASDNLPFVPSELIKGYCIDSKDDSILPANSETFNSRSFSNAVTTFEKETRFVAFDSELANGFTTLKQNETSTQ